MSNCIQIHNNKIIFTPEEFNIESFEKLRKEHSEHKDKSPKNLDIRDTFCWFLRSNSRLLGNGALEISFGRGASSHTWRDFQQTIWFLNQFIKMPKTHTFQIADEYDGFDTIEPLTINFPYSSFEDLLKSLH